MERFQSLNRYFVKHSQCIRVDLFLQHEQDNMFKWRIVKTDLFRLNTNPYLYNPNLQLVHLCDHRPIFNELLAERQEAPPAFYGKLTPIQMFPSVFFRKERVPVFLTR